jgi:hypothetical protein
VDHLCDWPEHWLFACKRPNQERFITDEVCEWQQSL